MISVFRSLVSAKALYLHARPKQRQTSGAKAFHNGVSRNAMD